MLSKKESKFRQKIFAEYHLDKLAQIAFDKEIKKLNTTYKIVYLFNEEIPRAFIPKYTSLTSIISGSGFRAISKKLAKCNSSLEDFTFSINTTSHKINDLIDIWNELPLENYVRIDNV